MILLTGCSGEAAAIPPSQTPAGFGATRTVPPRSIGYRLPVVGTWRVLRTHYGATNDQAYALDLVMISQDGEVRLNRSAARDNSGFVTYRQPIVADAPGVIVISVDGVPENTPGVVNKYDMHGNFVVIDHENGEYSLMAHLIPGSVRVRIGQRVEAGAELGLCGNSGHSTMPHLHWQVMDNINASLARGIPPRLLSYERNGAMTVEIPQKGDTLLVPR